MPDIALDCVVLYHTTLYLPGTDLDYVLVSYTTLHCTCRCGGWVGGVQVPLWGTALQEGGVPALPGSVTSVTTTAGPGSTSEST